MNLIYTQSNNAVVQEGSALSSGLCPCPGSTSVQADRIVSAFQATELSIAIAIDAFAMLSQLADHRASVLRH